MDSDSYHQCFEFFITVGWVTGRTSVCKNLLQSSLEIYFKKTWTPGVSQGKESPLNKN